MVKFELNPDYARMVAQIVAARMADHVRYVVVQEPIEASFYRPKSFREPARLEADEVTFHVHAEPESADFLMDLIQAATDALHWVRDGQREREREDAELAEVQREEAEERWQEHLREVAP